LEEHDGQYQGDATMGGDPALTKEDPARGQRGPETAGQALAESTTPFVDREEELNQLQALVADPVNRIITIVGPGGAGKTRLALEAARRQRDAMPSGSSARFPDGVFFAPLAALESADELWPALNQALGFQPSSQDDAGRSSKQQLLDFLSSRALLLVLDNFEQLLGAAQFLSDLSKAAPTIQLLVTSRERLSLQRERLFILGGMNYPEQAAGSAGADQVQGYSALQLFTQRAQRVDHTFQLHPDNLADMARICQLVDGLPLAIELAATWVDSISLSQISREIEQSLSLLETDAQDADIRHRSMTVVFDASWQHLQPETRRLFAKLTVFQGGFTRPAAEAVAQVNLRQLTQLIKKSLLQYDRDNERYQMHRLVRQYGAQKLAGDSTAEELARDQHCAYFCSLLEVWARGIKGERQLETMAAFDLEIKNARVAWEWAVKRGFVHQIDQALEALGHYCDWRWLPDELADLCRMAAEKLITIDSGEAKRVLSKVLAWQGSFIPAEEAVELLNKSLALIEELESVDVDVRAERAWALRRLGHEIIWQDHAEAARTLRQSRDTYKGLNDTWGTADALGYLGANALFWGKYQDSRRYYQEKTVLCRAIGDRRGLAESLHVLALNAVYLGAFEEGELLARQSLALTKGLGDLRVEMMAYDDLGHVLWQLGRFSEAQTAYQECIAIGKSLGRPTGASSAMVVFLLAQQGQLEGVTSAAQAALEDRHNQACGYHTAFVCWALTTVYLQQDRLDEAIYWIGRSVAIFEEISHVTVQAGALATLTMVDSTTENLRRTIKAALAAGSVLAHIMTLAAVALHLAKQGDVVRAIELYSLISSYDMVSRSHWFDAVVGQPIQAMSKGVPKEEAAAAHARGRTLELEPALTELAIRFGALKSDDIIAGTESRITQDVPDPSQHGRYVQDSLLGVGGQAEVYRGLDLQTGKEIAIKRLLGECYDKELASHQTASVERFLREAQMLTQLEHPNIVKILDYLEEDGCPTIIMEYVPGGSLRDLLNDAPRMALERALPIALELADALARAHHLLIAHRDLKPENVLLAADGTPRLTDFGLARLVNRETQLTEEGALVGTFAYLSPEVIQGLEPDARADIWSFGVLLYEMLAGRRPFASSQVAAVLTAIISEPAPNLAALRPDAPPELVRLIDQMLVKDRDQRSGRMRQIAAELELISEQIQPLK
jgi:predicted ATPase/tRNA A-37 threonylcarbamoyl transferase component Bud32